MLIQQHLSMILGHTPPKVPCNKKYSTHHSPMVGGRIISMTKQSRKINILSPGRSTLKFPHNYILPTFLNESFQIIPGLLLSAATRGKMQLPKAVCGQICGSQF